MLFSADADVRAAEQRLALRKAQVGERWRALRAQARDILVRPATLGTLALLGGVLGWRSRAGSTTAAEPHTLPDRPPSLRSFFRQTVVGLLQSVAAVALEETVKSALAKTAPEAKPPR